jgi:hypothetical protein
MSARDEAIARRAIEVVHGVEITPHDDNSKPSMVDFLLHRGGERVGCAEISRITDPTSQRGEAILGRQEVRADSLHWTWDCAVDRLDARQGDNARVEALLRPLEALGFEGPVGEDQDTSRLDPAGRQVVREAALQLQELGVVYARVVGHEHGLVILSSAGFSISRGPDDILDAVAAFFTEHTDVAIKLSNHDGPERHAFLWVDHHEWGSWRALDAGTLPGSPPTIPDAVTHLWLAPWTSWSNPEGQRVWIWTRDEGWRQFIVPSDVFPGDD